MYSYRYNMLSFYQWTPTVTEIIVGKYSSFWFSHKIPMAFRSLLDGHKNSKNIYTRNFMELDKDLKRELSFVGKLHEIKEKDKFYQKYNDTVNKAIIDAAIRIGKDQLKIKQPYKPEETE